MRFGFPALIYSLVVRTYGLVIRLAAIRHNKAKLWSAGRKDWRKDLEKFAATRGPHKTIWIHCASYGEFEQGRPLIELIKKEKPGHSILLTFFSPSGFEAFKHWNGADHIMYLPLDTARNAKDFTDLANPEAAIFIKYEFWLHFLFELEKRKIRTFLVSAVFKPHHPFFRWYGGIFKRSLRVFEKLFVQDQRSAALLRKVGVLHFEIAGDTRFDRVIEVRNTGGEIGLVSEFAAAKMVIVGGSTWAEDDELLINAFVQTNDPGLRMVLVPHEVDKKTIEGLCERITKTGLPCTLYSSGQIPANCRILIVDVMGLLSRLYRYATVAYVGGGFSGGLHNTLEAAVYGIPVFFYGDHDRQFVEVEELRKLEVAFPIHSTAEFRSELEKFIAQPFLLADIREKLARYFEIKGNSARLVLDSMTL
jgi:3-deoxy-D-manno-octulosonic-acid transferase